MNIGQVVKFINPTDAAEHRVSRIRRNLENKLLIFDGYDGKRYTAFIQRVYNGIAVVRYSAGFGKETIVGYVAEPSRLWWRD